MKIELEEKYVTWNEIITKTARHWGAKKRLFDIWKDLVGWAIYQVEDKPSLPFKRKVDLSFLVTYKKGRGRTPDVDGVCVKPIIDALVEHGVLVDDSIKWVESLHIKLEAGDKNKIIIDIE